MRWHRRPSLPLWLGAVVLAGGHEKLADGDLQKPLTGASDAHQIRWENAVLLKSHTCQSASKPSPSLESLNAIAAA
jgi:hypothetical protein